MIEFLDQLWKASSASILFECGFWSIELLLLGQKRFYIIWVRASVPQIASFWPAAPLYYSSAGIGPSNCFFWANNASILFECGLRSLELLLSGRRCLYIIWVGFGPSNCFFRASSASIIFECRLWSLELLLSGQQRLYITRVWASVPWIASFGPSMPLHHLSADSVPPIVPFGPSAPLYQSNEGFALWISISPSMFSPLPETQWQ
jgi:hypothetical protein